MYNQYWIQEWANVRQDEVIRFPEQFEIHTCYLKNITQSNLINAFKKIWNIYLTLYGDLVQSPEKFGMPLFKIEEHEPLSLEARESRNATYRPFILLYTMLITGDIEHDTLIVDSEKFKSKNKLKNSAILFERLTDYGFIFEGLKNYKLTNQSFSLLYPNHPNVIPVLKYMADKASQNDRLNDFLCCHYKLFQDDLNTTNYGNSVDCVADKMHSKEEQEFIYELDHILKELGYFGQPKAWNEGPGYAYYDKEHTMKANGPYHYFMLSWKTKLVLYLRIRNASNCLDYLNQCPDSIKAMFLSNDQGCKNRINHTCQYGQEYHYEGKTIWKCGCYSAPFKLHPLKEDIPHYIKLVELGINK